jgi:hypothetical protein
LKAENFFAYSSTIVTGFPHRRVSVPDGAATQRRLQIAQIAPPPTERRGRGRPICNGWRIGRQGPGEKDKESDREGGAGTRSVRPDGVGATPRLPGRHHRTETRLRQANRLPPASRRRRGTHRPRA